MKRFEFALSLVCTLVLSSAAHSATLRTVALSGQQAPGTPDGVVFDIEAHRDRAPVLNDAGQTAFSSRLTGSGVDFTNDWGIWSEGSGSLALVARKGQQAPGMPDGVSFGSLSQTFLVLNDAGQTAFCDRLGGSSIWSEGSGNLALVARAGDQAPGTPSGVGYSFVWPNVRLNDVGQTAFLATLTGSGVDSTNDRGIWSEGSGNLALLAREGDHALGMPDGVNFEYPFSSPLINDAGQTAFIAGLTGTGVDSTNAEGIWSEGSGTLALVARAGDPAPGTPTGINFLRFFYSGGSTVALNNAGHTALAARLTGSGVDLTNDYGLWSDRSGSLELVARMGDQAPGLPSGVTYGSYFDYHVLNDADQIAFITGLAGSGVDSTNNVGIWSEGSGSLALVARKGDQAPGAPDGVVFQHFSPPYFVLNDVGQTAFFALLTDSEGASAGRGIWATDRSGDLQLIVRSGDLMEVAPGDFRTIGGIEIAPDRTGNGDGRPSYFNNRGQLAFAARFTDGTAGIFVSNRVAIPEPSALLLGAITLLGLLASREGAPRSCGVARP